MAFSHIHDSATIGTTEYFLGADSTAKSLQTTDCMLQVWIDFSAMAAGDRYTVKFYKEVNNVERSWVVGVLDGAQSEPFVLPAQLVGGASGAWDVSVDKDAGTDRAIAWTLEEVT